MRKLIGCLAALLLSGAAHATTVTANGGVAEILLVPRGGSATITIGLTPDAQGVAAYNLVFDLGATADVTIGNCTGIVSGVQLSCSDPAGPFFSFGGLVPDVTDPFDVASFQVNVGAGAVVGSTLILSALSTITEVDLDEPSTGQRTIVRVAVPEPLTALVLGLGLGGLAMLGRRGRA